MRLFGLTKLGYDVARSKPDDGSPEMATLKHLRRVKTASDSEIEAVSGSKYMASYLKRKNLLLELTT